MKDLIIYHRVDLDGVASAAIVVKFLKEKGIEYELMGWNYGDPIPDVIEMQYISRVWILDISFGKDHEKMCKRWNEFSQVVWIDHHKTAIPEHLMEGKEIYGIRRVGTAACELTWEYVYGSDIPCSIIEYLSAYDVWDKDRFEWSDVLAVQYAMRSKIELNVDYMVNFLGIYYSSENIVKQNNLIDELITQGECMLDFIKQKNKTECSNYSFTCLLNLGKSFLLNYNAICMNTLEFNSTTFNSVYNEELHDIMMPFCIAPNGIIRFSLYSTKDDIDCGEIAKLFGGGGHKGAAGFQLDIDDNRFIYFLSNHKLLLQL